MIQHPSSQSGHRRKPWRLYRKKSCWQICVPWLFIPSSIFHYCLARAYLYNPQWRAVRCRCLESRLGTNARSCTFARSAPNSATEIWTIGWQFHRVSDKHLSAAAQIDRIQFGCWPADSMLWHERNNNSRARHTCDNENAITLWRMRVCLWKSRGNAIIRRSIHAHTHGTHMLVHTHSRSVGDWGGWLSTHAQNGRWSLRPPNLNCKLATAWQRRSEREREGYKTRHRIEHTHYVRN